MNSNLEKSYLDYLKYFKHRSDLNLYHDFIYKIPIKTGNDISILWITASPINHPRDTLMSSIMNYKNLVMILCICLIIFFFVTRHRMKYINEICSGIKTIANKDLNFRIRQKGHDELSEISKNINFMADKIKEKIESERKIESSKNALITNVAHDIRSPLTSII